MRSPLNRIVVSVTLTVLVVSAVLALRTRPIGLFESRPIVGYHADGDVLRFRRGRVTFATCCGSTPMGIYFRSNGVWVWQVRGINWAITPGVSSLLCREIVNPTNICVLQRRLRAPMEKGHDEKTD